MTTYVGTNDLNFILNGFVDKYYGTNLDDVEETTLQDVFYTDMELSFDNANELMAGIPHVKYLPFGTQSDGKYPYHVRALQSNLMIYQRLRSRHYGEFTDGVPSWINTYFRAAESILADIRGQNVVFDEDVMQGESGISVGSYIGTRGGVSKMYSNWDIGIYTGYEFPRKYRFVIDGTASGNVIGSSTFKWSRDGGNSFEATLVTTSTSWVDVEDGLAVRWEAVGTGTLQCGYGDTFEVRCVPMNIPTKAGQVKFTTFKRG